MTAEEIRRRKRFKCIHRHSGLSHPQCFNQSRGQEERIGFADIEASNLNATFGICYAYCIKAQGGELISRVISLDDLHRGIFDKILLKQFCEDAGGFTRLIWHYGVDRKFDLPFLRTRAVKFGLDFPEWKSLWVSDTHPILRNKFKLHSNRLETACNFFGIPCKQHKLNSDVWLEMITGNKKRMSASLRYIQTHCEEDVRSLEALWLKIAPYTRLAKTSI